MKDGLLDGYPWQLPRIIHFKRVTV
uniref:Uncharacterized protein n=1 Tax=Anguilla anguilla TaxID=7936 RepID=A0A0E9PB73_ANGAN